MALSPTLVDREQNKFVETSDGKTAVRVVSAPSDPTYVQQTGFAGASNTRPSITNVDATALASNTSRKYASFTNNGGATIYLKLGATAVVNQGIPLGPNEMFEIKGDNLFTGAVHAIKSTAIAVNLDVFEGS